MNPSHKVKEEIVEISRRLYQKGFVVANEGNISVKLNDRIVVTPTRRSKGFLSVKDLATVDLKGKKLEGELEPTSELLLHLFVYQKRPDLGTVIHAHPPYATAVAVAGSELSEDILPEVFLSLGKIPLASYGTPSTKELPNSVARLILKHDAILLKNHGVLTIGKELEEAYFKLERTEHFAHIFVIASSLGGVEKLSRKQMDKLRELKSRLKANSK
jgi:L-fuculose-phosphate aldolase